MTDGYAKCKNCGGDYGIHHAYTDQCPLGGVETLMNKNQEWQATTFAREVPLDSPDRLAKEMTVREHFAAMAMVGILSHPNTSGKITFASVSMKATAMADDLIDELNKEAK